MSLADFSIVQWCEGAEPHKCGYCNRNGNISNGMWAERLTVEDYQDLLDRGWRRSGKYCYKSIMNETCCPLYTIKCDAVNFSISKSQKRVIKKFKRFLKDGDFNVKNYLYDTHFEEPESSRELPVSIPEFNLSDISSIPDLTEQVPQEGSICDTNTNFKQKENNVQQIKGKCDNRVIGADPDKPKCKKAKFLRIERKKEKALKKGIPFNNTPRVPTRKALEEFFEEVLSEDNKHKLRTCLIPTSRSNSSWQAQEAIEFQLYKKYQMVIHKDPPSKLTVNGFCRFLVDSPLKTTLERIDKNSDIFKLSAEIYKKYQTIIHKEPVDSCNEDEFYNFLVETPLQPKNFPDGIEGPGYGSFHQQYWLGDKLIAVGVIDILPKCVSSVYFFYDPDYRGLTLGTYGSLREILLTRQLQKSLPDLGNYYMGFYIHSCQKMRYKGRLKPSVLLCPETYYWIPIEKCIPLLNISSYSRLNEDLDAIDPNLPSEQEILKIQIIFRNRLMSCSRYLEFVDEQEKYIQIGKLIGRKCVKSIIFFE